MDWICVSDRLPAKYEDVLFLADGVDPGIGYYHPESCTWYATDTFAAEGGEIYRRITHWMPLSALPKPAQPPLVKSDYGR